MSKAFVIVLVVLVMLFVVTVALGGSHGGSADAGVASPVAFLRGLQSNAYLRIGDHATTTCVNAPAGSSVYEVAATPCDVAIAGRGFLHGPTQIAFDAAGAPLDVLVAPTSGRQSDQEVDAGSCFQSAVSRQGGTVALTALSSLPATITLRTSRCP